MAKPNYIKDFRDIRDIAGSLMILGNRANDCQDYEYHPSFLLEIESKASELKKCIERLHKVLDKR